MILKENEELTEAEAALSARDFAGALNILDGYLARNPGDFNAYWCRFKARLGAANDFDVREKLINATPEIMEDVKNYARNTVDEQAVQNKLACILPFVLDAVIGYDWEKKKIVLGGIEDLLNGNDAGKVCDFLYSGVTGQLPAAVRAEMCCFLCRLDKDNKYANAGGKELAMSLFEAGKYELAERLFAELGDELHVLMCVLRTNDLNGIDFSLNNNMPGGARAEESFSKAVCAAVRDGDDNAVDIISTAVKHLIERQAEGFCETAKFAAAAFFAAGRKDIASDLMIECGTYCRQEREFKSAEEYYTHALEYDGENAEAHWGLLLSKLRILDDIDAAANRSAVLASEQYAAVMKYATPARREYYSGVMSGNIKPERKNKRAYNRRHSARRNVVRAIICSVVVVLLLITVGVVWFLREKYESPFMYTRMGDGYLISRAYRLPEGDLVLPEEYDGLPIVGVADNGFADCTELTSVKLPSTAVYIGDRAFANCEKLSDISMPDSLSEIKSSAFANCTSLVFVKLPEGVVQIAEGLFYNCTNLNCVILGGAVEYIENMAFYNCVSLESISVPIRF